MTLEVAFDVNIPSQVPGSFVLGIDFENFELKSEIGRAIHADCIYAISCTDNKIYIYK